MRSNSCRPYVGLSSPPSGKSGSFAMVSQAAITRKRRPYLLLSPKMDPIAAVSRPFFAWRVSSVVELRLKCSFRWLASTMRGACCDVAPRRPSEGRRQRPRQQTTRGSRAPRRDAHADLR